MLPSPRNSSPPCFVWPFIDSTEAGTVLRSIMNKRPKMELAFWLGRAVISKKCVTCAQCHWSEHWRQMNRGCGLGGRRCLLAAWWGDTHPVPFFPQKAAAGAFICCYCSRFQLSQRAQDGLLLGLLYLRCLQERFSQCECGSFSRALSRPSATQSQGSWSPGPAQAVTGHVLSH